MTLRWVARGKKAFRADQVVSIHEHPFGHGQRLQLRDGNSVDIDGELWPTLQEIDARSLPETVIGAMQGHSLLVADLDDTELGWMVYVGALPLLGWRVKGESPWPVSTVPIARGTPWALVDEHGTVWPRGEYSPATLGRWVFQLIDDKD